jgi:hypothetical protein
MSVDAGLDHLDEKIRPETLTPTDELRARVGRRHHFAEVHKGQRSMPFKELRWRLEALS